LSGDATKSARTKWRRGIGGARALTSIVYLVKFLAHRSIRSTSYIHTCFMTSFCVGRLELGEVEAWMWQCTTEAMHGHSSVFDGVVLEIHIKRHSSVPAYEYCIIAPPIPSQFT